MAAGTQFYKQCFLRRGQVHQIVWIPEQFATPGNYVEIKGEDGWLVVSAWKRSTWEGLDSEGRDRRNKFASLR